jgi:hypothetical protein
LTALVDPLERLQRQIGARGGVGLAQMCWSNRTSKAMAEMMPQWVWFGFGEGILHSTEQMVVAATVRRGGSETLLAPVNVACNSVSVRRLWRGVEETDGRKKVTALKKPIAKQKTIDGRSELYRGDDSGFASDLRVGEIFRKAERGDPRLQLLQSARDDPRVAKARESRSSSASDGAAPSTAGYDRQRAIGRIIFKRLGVSPKFGTWSSVRWRSMAALVSSECLKMGRAIQARFDAEFGPVDGDLFLSAFMKMAEESELSMERVEKWIAEARQRLVEKTSRKAASEAVLEAGGA